MQSINIITAFLFGLLAFFSPCTFPLVPSFLSYILGVSVSQLENNAYTKKHRNTILLHIITYILGSCLTLVLLGTAAGEVGTFFRLNRYLLQQIGGVIVILFGFSILHVLPIQLLYEGTNFHKLDDWIMHLRKQSKVFSYISAFLIGVVFTLGWIPCISAILGSILILAASTQNVFYGGLLLFVYALGQNLPLLLFGGLLSLFLGYFVFLRKYNKVFQIIAGILLVCMGIILLAGSFSFITQNLYLWASRLGI